ncbi:hypothetical protein FRX31_012451, partial [Thalictrum thalictroides]
MPGPVGSPSSPRNEGQGRATLKGLLSVNDFNQSAGVKAVELPLTPLFPGG